MDRNLFLALLLSSLVYILWFGWMARHRGAPPAAFPAPVASLPAPKAAQVAEQAESAAEKKASAPDIQFQEEKFWAGMDSRLGTLHSYQFRDGEEWAELIPKGSPHFFLSAPGAGFRLLEKDRRYCIFVGRDPSQKVVFRKRFDWNAESYLHQATLALENPSAEEVQVQPWTLEWGPGLDTVRSEKKENAGVLRVVALGSAPRMKKLKPGRYPGGGWRWAGLDNRYFLLAAVLPEGVEGLVVPEPAHKGEGPSLRLEMSPIKLPPHGRREWKFPFYFGPKDYSALASLNLRLEETVDFGFFGFLGRWAFRLLMFFHRITGNFGWAIVLLTALVQALMFPLSWKGFKASLAMKKIQPQVQLVQQKYKEDPRRMQVEMMQLYKSAGANPLSGCLPLLLQMPVFFALFATLRNIWVLRGAPFLLWIRDLSAKDPYYVLPILMGATMVLQQKKNPVAADPAQAKMMMLMPIVFTFMFLQFPSGLVLYWLTSNLLSMAQQSFLGRRRP